ncbi:MAG: hypothetical protein Ct9H300mP8_11130 [Gammaproteobacteria bacterium]|nr:MAG: hypothetical protein Ct9H300mP8_11130 [Gammaproteobacteria bacterium]
MHTRLPPRCVLPSWSDRYANVVGSVGGDNPAVFRVCFANVDDEKFDLLAPSHPEVMQGPQLGPERWSRIGTKDESDGFFRRAFQQVECVPVATFDRY